MDSLLAGREYASHLTDADLRLLASLTAWSGGAPGSGAPGSGAAGTGGDRAGGSGVARLRRDPAALLTVIGDPRVFRAVLGPGAGGPGPAGPGPAGSASASSGPGRAAIGPGAAFAADPASGSAYPVSPFLVFTVAVHQAAAELASLGYVTERTGTRQKVPLFDAPALRDFLGDPARRLFLAELLASFTKVASGRYRVRAGGQVRTRKFSELDPVRLAGLLDVVPDAERPGVYRRLGDVALFLTGVFPDYAATALGPVNVARLVRAAQVPTPDAARLAESQSLELLEYLGARWYRAARDLATVRTERLNLVAEVAERFRQARRVLNHMADRYLFPQALPWLPRPGS